MEEYSTSLAQNTALNSTFKKNYALYSEVRLRGRIAVATSGDTSQLTEAQPKKAGDGKASRDGFMSQPPVPSDGGISSRVIMTSEQAPQPSDRASQQSQI